MFWHSISVMCRRFQQWSVKLSHIRRQCSGRPRSTNALQDRCILWADVAAPTAFKEEIRAHVAPAVSPRTIGNFCLQQDSDHVCFWPGCHLHNDTAKHGYSRVVKEWTGDRNDVLLSSVMRVGCVYASDGRTTVWRRPGERHLAECTRPRHTGPISGFML